MKWLLPTLLLMSMPLRAQLTQSIVTGSRSLNTVYQNTSGQVMLVSATPATSGGVVGTNDITASILVDSVNPPLVTVAQKYSADQGAGISAGPTAIVPPNYYYKVTGTTLSTATVSISYWTEWNLTQLTSASVATPARVLGTIYHNTSGTNTVWVEAVVQDTATALCDSAATPTTAVAQEDTVSTHNATVIFPVLPGLFYKITGGTLVSWMEVTTSTPLNMTQNVVTSSRTVSHTPTTYAAGSQAVLASVVTLEGNAQAAGTVFAYSDTANPPSTPVAAEGRQTGQNAQLFFGVPEFYFYTEANDNPVTLTEWIEWDIPIAAGTFAGEKQRRRVY